MSQFLAFLRYLGMAILICVSQALFASLPASSADRTPLLLDGKKTLFQRVLTRPGAQLSRDAGAAPQGSPLLPLTHFYVYGRRDVGNVSWVELGPATKGEAIGWLPSQEVVEWRQQLTMAFTNPAGRERALLFRDRDFLMKLLDANDRPAQVARLRQNLAVPNRPADFPVISIEPATHIDINRQFYLLPILRAEEGLLPNGFPVQALEVASVNLRRAREAQNVDPKLLANQAERDEALRGYRAAIVFVIDTTISMGPYIDRTRDAVRRVYDGITAAGLNDKVSFGLVGFRSSTKITPRLEYVSNVFAQPAEVKDAKRFLELVSGVKEATVSSHTFNEDAMAGLETAINDIKWTGFAGRYIVLITDAGAIRASDPNSKTGLDPDQVRQLALNQGIATFALHLLTPAGRRTHAEARAQYEAVTQYPSVPKPLYYAVESGSVERFGATMDALSSALAQQVKDASEGKLAPKPSAAAPPGTGSSQVQEDAVLVGLAMQLAYLGREKDTEAPSLFRAWAANRDLTTPEQTSMEVRVLLSKTQLGDLQNSIKLIVDAGKRGQIAPADFFDQLRSAAAAMSRDPSRIGRRDASKLGQLGLLGEYLDDLPFKSKVLSIDADQWERMSIGEQQAFIDELEAKTRLYQKFHDDVDKWVSLDGGKVPGDAVYPVPLEALP